MNRFAPWAGWIGGILGWLTAGQADSIIAQDACRRADPGVMLAIAVAGAILVIAGAFLSFTAWRAGGGEMDRPGAGTRRFVAATGAIAGSLFLLALVFQTISSFILPQCHA